MEPPREEAAEWLRVRSQRATVVGVISAILLCWTLMGPLVILFVTWLQHHFAQRLLAQGVFVEAELIAMPEDTGATVQTVLEAWDVVDHQLPDLSRPGGVNPMDYLADVMAPVVAAASRALPSIPLRYAFTLDGRRREAGRYMFGHERFARDDEGALWVWVDPKQPQLNTWLVSRLDALS